MSLVTSSHYSSLRLITLTLSLLLVGLLLSPATSLDNLIHLPGSLALSTSASFEKAVLHYTLLPRLSIALLTGAALGLAGTLVQQVLRNPMAAPTTLGVAAGAQLALGLVMLLAPSLLVWREAWAMAGGLAALALVLLMGARRGFDPLTLTLCGLIVSLYLGAINTVILLFNQEQLAGLFIWGAGELSQNDWRSTIELLPRLAVAAGVALALWRPLQALDLGTEGARSLGLSPGITRVLTLMLAVYLTALTVSHVGVVGFIGLAAPAIVRLLGARTLRQRMLASALTGALICLIADGIAQQLTLVFGHLLFPTGAATALIGGPVLLWVLTRNRLMPARPAEPVSITPSRKEFSKTGLLVLGLIILGSLAITLLFGPSWEGWQWTSFGGETALLAMRMPRMTTALMAGGLLAGAGVIVQRLTRNPMASPELLGISTGAAMGMVVLTLSFGSGSRTLQILAGGLGGTLVLLALLLLSRRSSFSPQRLLLGGIALSALLDAGTRMILAAGDAQAIVLLNWLAGSTWLSGQTDAWVLVVVTPVLVFMAILATRWLDMMPLGDSTVSSLGLPLAPARLLLLLLAALMTAAATLVVGPLSFVGLMAPHLARLLGYQRALPQLLAAFVIGSLLMLWADWIARSVVYPYELPAGLVATLIGGGYFLMRMYRMPSRH
ncbi:MAG: Fe(3+)-hydroxamate ABC transporter permease FhuB [Marinobacter sp.]